jgi:hypothetical protein
MKNVMLILLLALTAITLPAQTGLFGLSYGDSLNRADSLMSSNGFVARSVEGSMVKYHSDYNELVESVVLFVQPETEVLAGWFVKYSKDNTEQQDHFVLDKLHEMHGVEVLVDQESEKVTWVFDASRSVTVGYSSDGSLCAYYYDAALKQLFTIPASSLLK